jgi:DNA-binding MarR family transcriptional regulator
MSTSPVEGGADARLLAVDLLVTSARFTRLVAREAPPVIPHALWRALAQLQELGPTRVNDLAAADRVSQPTATVMVQKLVERGWAERCRDPLDGRAVQVWITEAGHAALTEARQMAAEALLPRMKRLDGNELRALEAGVKALSVLMDGERDADGPDGQ